MKNKVSCREGKTERLDIIGKLTEWTNGRIKGDIECIKEEIKQILLKDTIIKGIEREQIIEIYTLINKLKKNNSIYSKLQLKGLDFDSIQSIYGNKKVDIRFDKVTIPGNIYLGNSLFKIGDKYIHDYDLDETYEIEDELEGEDSFLLKGILGNNKSTILIGDSICILKKGTTNIYVKRNNNYLKENSAGVVNLADEDVEILLFGNKLFEIKEQYKSGYLKLIKEGKIYIYGESIFEEVKDSQFINFSDLHKGNEVDHLIINNLLIILNIGGNKIFLNLNFGEKELNSNILKKDVIDLGPLKFAERLSSLF